MVTANVVGMQQRTRQFGCNCAVLYLVTTNIGWLQKGSTRLLRLLGSPAMKRAAGLSVRWAGMDGIVRLAVGGRSQEWPAQRWDSTFSPGAVCVEYRVVRSCTSRAAQNVLRRPGRAVASRVRPFVQRGKGASRLRGRRLSCPRRRGRRGAARHRGGVGPAASGVGTSRGPAGRGSDPFGPRGRRPVPLAVHQLDGARRNVGGHRRLQHARSERRRGPLERMNEFPSVALTV